MADGYAVKFCQVQERLSSSYDQITPVGMAEWIVHSLVDGAAQDP